MLKTDFIRRFTKILLFVNVFVIETMFRQRSFTDKSIDLQVMIKMGLWLVTFVFCAILYRLWLKKLARIDNVFQIFLLIMIFISCFYAPNTLYSLAAVFSLLTVFSLLFLASSVLNNREIIFQIISGCTLVIALSIIVYYVDPDFGRMKEWHGNLHLPGKRMSGITGTPNTVGYISAMCLIALYYYREYLPRPLPLGYLIVVALNIFALVMSNSRTSMVALIGAITVAGILKLSPPRLAAFFIFICLTIVFFATVDLDSVFALLSRSGDPREITSGTGRSEIWKAVIALIGERPMFGWGYGSSTFILPAQREIIGESVTSAHNAILQVILSIGFVGLIFFVLVMGTKVYYSFKSREPLNIAFIVFLLIDGMTEAIAFQGVATTTTLMLSTVLALNYRTTNETVDTAYQQRLSGSVAT